MLEARAIHRYISSSPRKMRLVIDLIRGRSVPDALSILHFQPKQASKAAEKVLRSAIANLHQKDEGSRIDNETLYVKTVYVDCGPSQKRVLPAPMGRAYRIVKRSNHLTIVIAQRQQKRKKAAPAAAGAKPKVKESTTTKE
jgi:large subunit ribosomal protein L22